MAEGFVIAGTIPFALLGSTHLALTLRDVRCPRYIKPTDDASSRRSKPAAWR